MSNMENVLNNIMMPIMINLFVLVGVIVSLVGITVTLYGLFKKKWTGLRALKYFLSTTVLGVLVSAIGVLIVNIGDFELYTNSYRYEIPIGYILSLCIFWLLAKKQRKDDGTDA